jgi:hypothetical protein
LRRTVCIPLILLALLVAGCKSTYYKAMQTLGKEKRDILVQRIKDLIQSIDASSQEADKLIASLAASDSKN